jgi:hypothetical protein
VVVSSLEPRRRRFDHQEDFFAQNGSYWMKLSREAAISVVKQCQSRNEAVSIIEGGIWGNPGFQTRLDAIWHSHVEQRPTGELIKDNNMQALTFLANQMPEECDTVIISLFKD